MNSPIKPIEVTEQIPVAVPVPSVPRPELFVVQMWEESHKLWCETIEHTPEKAQAEARDWDVAHIFRIPGEEEMNEKDRLIAAAPEMLEAAISVLQDWTNDDDGRVNVQYIAALRAVVTKATGASE